MASDVSAYMRLKLHDAWIEQQVFRVEIEDVDRGSDMATFVMEDQGALNSDGVEPEMPVRIELGWETEYALAFVGRVKSKRAVAAVAGSRSRTEVTCIDDSAKLQTRPEMANRKHEGSLKEIIEKIAKRAKIPVGQIKLESMPKYKEGPIKPDELPALNQLDKTDWEFLQDLAEKNRSRCFVEVNWEEKDSEAIKKAGGEPKLYFISEKALLAQEPMGTLLYCRGMGKLLEFDYTRVASGATPVATGVVANPDTGKAEVKQGQPPPPAPEPAPSPTRTDQAIDVGGKAAGDDHAAALANVADSPNKPEDGSKTAEVTGAPSDPKALEAKIEQDRTRILGFSGKGTAMGTVFLRAKGSVNIEGIASTAAGRWYVRRVNHIYERAEVNKKISVSFRSKLEATR